jgi:hypothetical protein
MNMMRESLLATGFIAVLVLAAAPAPASDETTTITPPAQQQTQGSETGAPGMVECGMPMTEHQRQVLRHEEPTTGGGQPFPPTKHQEQVLRGSQQSDTTDTTPGETENGMPATKHQLQTLNKQPTAPGMTQTAQRPCPETQVE